MTSDRSTIRSPSSLIETLNHGSGRGAGPATLTPSCIEAAAVARAGNQSQFRRPRRAATQVRARRRKGVESFGPVDDVDSRFGIRGDRPHWILIRLARVGDGRGFVEHVGREEFIAEGEASRSRAGQASQAQLFEDFAPAAFVLRRRRRLLLLIRLGFIRHGSGLLSL